MPRGAGRAEPLLKPADQATKLLRGGAGGARRPATAARRLRRHLHHGARDPRALRRLATFHDGARRHAFLRPCRLFRARRLWRGARGQVAGRAHGGRPAGGAAPRRTGGPALRLVLRAALGRLSRHADARLRADRLGDRPSSGSRSRVATTASSASGQAPGRRASWSSTIWRWRSRSPACWRSGT